MRKNVFKIDFDFVHLIPIMWISLLYSNPNNFLSISKQSKMLETLIIVPPITIFSLLKFQAYDKIGYTFNDQQDLSYYPSHPFSVLAFEYKGLLFLPLAYLSPHHHDPHLLAYLILCFNSLSLFQVLRWCPCIMARGHNILKEDLHLR